MTRSGGRRRGLQQRSPPSPPAALLRPHSQCVKILTAARYSEATGLVSLERGFLSVLLRGTVVGAGQATLGMTRLPAVRPGSPGPVPAPAQDQPVRQVDRGRWAGPG